MASLYDVKEGDTVLVKGERPACEALEAEVQRWTN